MSQFDVTVIGSGPRWLRSCIKIRTIRFQTGLLSKYSTLNRTCENVGCILSKALLDKLRTFQENTSIIFANHGIIINEPRADFIRMVVAKTIVDQTTKN